MAQGGVGEGKPSPRILWVGVIIGGGRQREKEKKGKNHSCSFAPKTIKRKARVRTLKNTRGPFLFFVLPAQGFVGFGAVSPRLSREKFRRIKPE